MLAQPKFGAHVCPSCTRDLPANGFNRNQWYCKECQSVKAKSYWQRNGLRLVSKKMAQHKCDPRHKLLAAAKHRAKALGLPFNLTLADLPVPDRCPVLGIPLVVAGRRMQDGSPSVDKIIPALGYVPGNVCVVSWRANRLKGDATAAELTALAAYAGRVLDKAKTA